MVINPLLMFLFLPCFMDFFREIFNYLLFHNSYSLNSISALQTIPLGEMCVCDSVIHPIHFNKIRVNYSTIGCVLRTNFVAVFIVIFSIRHWITTIKVGRFWCISPVVHISFVIIHGKLSV